MPCARRPKPLVLLTDFGPQSPYVGQMKLVLERIAPGARVLDLAHDLPPGDVTAATLILSGALRFMPRASVLCVVVDPGVGSGRRILAARFRGELQAVFPDNGLWGAFERLGPPRALHAVTRRRFFPGEVSPVFHGRDILAPVAARLAAGVKCAQLGPPVRPDACAPSPWPAPRTQPRLTGVRVIYIDRFGNLVTNLPAAELPPDGFSVRCRRRAIPFGTHYAEVSPGRPLALVGSHEYLEVAVREGSAARTFRARVGTPVEVVPAKAT